jgi:hypothetical protein
VAALFRFGWLIDEAQCKAAPCSFVSTVVVVGVGSEWFIRAYVLDYEFGYLGGPYETRGEACAELLTYIDKIRGVPVE